MLVRDTLVSLDGTGVCCPAYIAGIDRELEAREGQEIRCRWCRAQLRLESGVWRRVDHQSNDTEEDPW